MLCRIGIRASYQPAFFPFYKAQQKSRHETRTTDSPEAAKCIDSWRLYASVILQEVVSIEVAEQAESSRRLQKQREPIRKAFVASGDMVA